MGADKKGRHMEIVVAASYAEMSVRAAETICAALRTNPRLVLGLPTGATPLGMYRQLAAAHARGEADFSQARTFNLDEYCGLGPAHPASYHTYMRENLLAHVNLPPERMHVPDGSAPDLEAECNAYAQAIAAAGELDLAVLGIGENGHVGFNEPNPSLLADVHVAVLHFETRSLAYAYWRDRDENPFPSLAAFPEHAITMGMGTILRAKQILLLASGAKKALAVGTAVHGPLSPWLPASFLQLHHCVTLIVDSEAAGEL